MPFLTASERRVLELMSRTGQAMHSRDFKDVATVTSGRWEWANPILQRLQGKGLVLKGTTKTFEGFSWTITKEGREALLSAPDQARPAPKGLTFIMENELRRLGRAETEGREIETVLNRTTWQGLERRELVSLHETDTAWLRPSLTEKGREFLGMPPKAAEPREDIPDMEM